MNKFYVYLRLECKRILRLFPAICLITAVLLMVAGLLFVNGKNKNKSDKTNTSQVKNLKEMTIGIVSDESDSPLLNMGLYMVEQTDNLRYICSFMNVTEERGQRLLEKEQIDVLAILPDDYIKSVYRGTDKPIIIRFGSSQAGASSLMFRQLADIVSDYLMESRAGVYAMQDMYTDWGISYKKDADRLSERYVLKISSRANMLNEQTINVTGNLSAPLYYMSVGIILIMLFWGLNCGSVLGRNEKMMSVLLERQNLSQSKQYLAKYISLFLLFLLNYAVIVTILNLVVLMLNIEFVSAISFFKIIPILFLVCSIVLCVYEISNDGIGGMIFLFFSTIILGFLSGFFYPVSYFPIWFQNISKILPTRVMLDYVQTCIADESIIYRLIIIIIYAVIFSVITIICSNRSIRISAIGRKYREKEI